MLKGAGTWHAAFDDKGALTATENVPFSLAKDEDVADWTRDHRETWTPDVGQYVGCELVCGREFYIFLSVPEAY